MSERRVKCEQEELPLVEIPTPKTHEKATGAAIRIFTDRQTLDLRRRAIEHVEASGIFSLSSFVSGSKGG